jgi:two-component system sensor histidine kinase BarA
MILSSIKMRIMLLATIPVTVTAIVLAAYFIRGQLQSADQELNSHGESTARHLARACEYGVFAGNPDILRPIVVSALEEESVISVTVTDQFGATIIQESKPTSANQNAFPLESDKTLSFSHAITLLPIEIDELASEPPGAERLASDTLGWVIVKLSTNEANRKRAAAIRNTLIITFLGIALSILLALHFGNKLTSPLLRLTSAVRKIGEGNLSISIDTTSTGELGSLETGIDGMLQSLRDSRDNLQKQVDKATTDLRHSLQIVEKQNIELRSARQDALLANNAKTVFLANVSHEIRTPLNGILGFVKLLKKTGLKREQEDYVETIEKSAENLLYLIGDILDISRIESGKLALQDVSFNLKECIEDIVTLLAPSAYDKSLDISSIFYDDVPAELLGAPDRIRQILINLVGNAIKFSYQGTIVIRTSLEEEENEDVLVRISVTDQGIGISQQDKDVLFNSFSQLDNSTTRRYGGAGLGLSISKSLAEIMGGMIGVESSEDKGSTFWFTFRAKRLEHSTRETAGNQPFSNTFALFYDENYHSSLAIMHLLRGFGVSVSTCNGIDDFNQQLTASTRIDLIVLGLSKEEALPEKIRLLVSTVRQHSAAGILCFINSVDPITLLQVREHGCNACISKTTRSREIVENVKTLLAMNRSNHEDATSPLAPKMDARLSDISNNKNPFGISLSSVKILIAEDNDINAKLLCTILDQTGAMTTLVKDGKRAVELFTQHSFDLILMDVHMPEKNGVQATAEIREMETGQERIPIIGLTASVLANERKMYLNAGMDDLLIKPVSIDRLLQTVQLWSSRRGKHSSGANGAGVPPDFSVAKGLSERGVMAGSNKLTRTLLDMLIDEIPVTRENLQQAFADKNWDLLAELVHKLLGGLGYCDVPALKSAVENLQNKLHPVTEALPKALDNVFDEMQWLVDRYRGKDDV